ncbi:thermonuclease family protein [Leptolyngbya sp. FACHB-261]|uniref:thermonuclease family protein n=1 Tax=Leptolyngbya sp. FACHB-261 TaxID=2692806 RepID=UPI001687F09D|nr:thermonuclease family protein [Leptolyngbya sp. FACHB-261]MBD2104090.1 thermonuclease family protein [Leptolyngbya sp. FACHB-261]
MPFVLIQGTFEPITGEPDGDSVRFQAEDDELFDKLEGRIEFKSGGQVQLRYEGIDALEKAAVQPFSSNATERNIELLGGKRPNLPGYILSSHADGNGRPVCFVFTGDPPDWDNNGKGDELQADLLRQSVNYRLLLEGHVYPMFYETLYKELRDEMVFATKEARAAKREIWSADRSTDGFQVDIPPDLSEIPPIFPKLWRRLQSFYQRRSNRNKGIEVFIRELSRGKDRLFTIPDQRSIKFSTTLEVDGDKITMLYRPEEMVFESDVRLERLAASITTSSIFA